MRAIINGIEKEDEPSGESLGKLILDARQETDEKEALSKSERRHQNIYTRWRKWFAPRACAVYDLPPDAFDNFITWECYAARLFQHRDHIDFHHWWYVKLEAHQRRGICDQMRKPIEHEE